MKKKILSIVLIFLVIIGSFVNFYATNMILGDVSNLTYGITNRPVYILASLPAFNLALIFVLATIFIIRYLRRPQYLKRMTRLYTILFMSFSFIGLISSILSGVLVYKTFTAPNPFPGYLIIGIILFSIFLLAGLFLFLFIYKKIPNDTEKRKMRAGYVFYSIVFAVLTYYAFNRFGAFLWIPSYVDIPTLYMTWPFYLYLLLPILMFVHTILYTYSIYKKHSFGALITICTITVFFIIGSVYTLCVGMANTTFISVISPSMGASRLLAKPIDFVVYFVAFGLLDAYSVYHSITYYKKHRTR